MASRTKTTRVLTEAALDWLARYNLAAYLEKGLNRRGKLRADVFATDTKGNLTCIEIKSGPEDFEADKKWFEYLKFSDRTYICISDAYYHHKKFPHLEENARKHGAGILVLSEETGLLYVAVKAKAQKGLSKKERFRLMVALAWKAAPHSKLTRGRRKIKRYIEQ